MVEGRVIPNQQMVVLEQSISAMTQMVALSAFTNIIGTLAAVDVFSLAIPSESIAIAKWNETTKYSHTVADLIRIRDGVGDSYIYHGAPEEYAEQIIIHGPQVPYSVEELGREVAAKYGIPWVTFRKYTHRVRQGELFTKLSTAPALIAFRWASSFKQGEVLTDLNTHGRILKESRKVALAEHMSIDNAYEVVLNRSEVAGKAANLQWTIENSADLLGLPDLYPRAKQTGAIVQFRVRSSTLSKLSHDATYFVNEVKEHGTEVLLHWNESYVDVKIAPEDILSKRIVVSGIPYRASDAVSEAIKTHKVDMKTGRILGKK